MLNTRQEHFADVVWSDKLFREHSQLQQSRHPLEQVRRKGSEGVVLEKPVSAHSKHMHVCVANGVGFAKGSTLFQGGPMRAKTRVCMVGSLH